MNAWPPGICRHWPRWLLLGLCVLVCLIDTAHSEDRLDDLLYRTSMQVSVLLERLSDVKCTEKVRQEKLSADGKVERNLDSAYDYLVLFANAGGELGLAESRLPLGEAKADRKNTPMLVTNGFASLFLVFHPYYAGSFRFADLDEEVNDGKRLKRVHFQYVRGTRSPAALALRAREYPLQLSGTAWIDQDTAAVVRIVADVEHTLEDVGVRTLRTEVDYAPVAVGELQGSYLLPARATVEVSTPRQHWRNTHVFTDYRQFSVSTKEQVTSK